MLKIMDVFTLVKKLIIKNILDIPKFDNIVNDKEQLKDILQFGLKKFL